MKPKITINQNNRYKLEEGENASLLCNASGYPEPEVIWSKQDKDRELEGKVTQLKSSISILTLKNVSVFWFVIFYLSEFVSLSGYFNQSFKEKQLITIFRVSERFEYS